MFFAALLWQALRRSRSDPAIPHSTAVPKTYQKVLDRLPDLFASGLALAFVVALVSGFHIAVSAALERMRESYFSFKTGTRDMTLQKGTLLLQVPKGLGGATIHAASITAAITGTTIMLESIPGKDIKVLVLEGTLRLSMNGRFGDSLLLTPGNMIMMSPHSRRIPDPVTIDLKKVVQTSTLVNMRAKSGKDASANSPSLPSMSLIEKEIARQQSGKDAHKLANTNLVINGKGTSASLGPDSLLYSLADRSAVDRLITAIPQTAVTTPPGPLPPTPVPTPHH